ncbi:MAG: rod shape-determining protein MreC [Clostridia bacterium]|nr:rod shape-determining protein MreC [Clostridia bacterium]
MATKQTKERAKPSQKRKTARPVSESQRRKRAAIQRRVRRIAIVVLVVGALLGAAYFLLNRDEKNVSAMENGVGSLFTMVQSGVSSAVGSVRDAFVDLSHYGELKAENERLQMENDTLTIRLQDASQALTENERLQTLLDAKNQYEALDPIYARVIARTPGAWFDTFSVNRGTLNGVSVGMAVITADGLVGRVYEVGLNYAKVLSVIDSRSAVATLVERTRDNGVMRGVVTSASEVAECYVYYLPNINSIIPGDTVITSGMDTLYPKGIPVGVVTEVSRDLDSTSQYVVVQPFVDFAHIEDVLILREVVETDTGSLTAVPTPTPVPVITPTPGPTSEAGDAAAGDGDADNQNWMRPTMPPMDALDGDATLAPVQTVAPANMAIPEDSWANN